MTTLIPTTSTRPAPAVRSAMTGAATLTVTVLRRAGTTEFQLEGELDATTSSLLDCLVTDALARSRGDLSLDLTGTRFCDVIGLNCLLATRRRVQADGGRLTLVGASPLLQHLLRLSGASDLVAASS